MCSALWGTKETEVGMNHCRVRKPLIRKPVGFIFFACKAGRMAVVRQGGWATQGAAEGMQLETLELDESMRGDDGVKGDVRDVLRTLRTRPPDS